VKSKGFLRRFIIVAGLALLVIVCALAITIKIFSSAPEGITEKDYDASLDQTVEIEFTKIPTNGIELYTAIAGPEGGKPVILLHGFPDVWYGWESQIRALAAKGFRVYAPDQRGYGLSDKPGDIIAYTQQTLVNDIIGLADSLGLRGFNLAGHDFGALVSWNVAIQYPERITKLVIINVPHPDVMPRYMKQHTSQLFRSWYVLFFQLPYIPERVVKYNNWELLIDAMSTNFKEQRLQRYRKSWSGSRTIGSMINWYRAVLRHPLKHTDPHITTPVLIIWGKRDVHIEHKMAPMSLEYCANGRLIYFDNASHWPHQDKPREVNKLLIDFFTD